MRRYAALALAALVVAVVVGVASASHGGTRTEKRPYLVPTAEGLAAGVRVEKILSTGDLVHGYQMSGIPDGLGAYRGHGRNDDDDDDDDDGGNRGGRFTVVMNHELGKTFPGQPTGVDARISRLEITRDFKVQDATYLFTGAEGFERFCSSTLRVINGKPYYFTGEEAVDAGHDGSSIVMNARTGQWWETPHFGHFQHENVVPLRLKKWVFLSSEDDFRVTPVRHASYLYAYIAPSFAGAVSGTQGDLYVWKADEDAKTGNATVVKGESVPGHFVRIDQSKNLNSMTLKTEANARGAFQFDRLEDVAVHRGRETRVYIADTGKPPVTARGRIYQFDFDRRDPTKATLKMILNADPPDNDNFANPDNMDASERVLVFQEDREALFRGDYSYVLTYRFPSGPLTRVARVDPTPPILPGAWESSGVIDARHVLGRDWWLLDVQTHGQFTSQPGAAPPGVQPPPNTGNGEDGQLLAIKIPGSQGRGGDNDHDDDDDD
jgi:Bacterial protein of unknown function (DUF839)